MKSVILHSSFAVYFSFLLLFQLSTFNFLFCPSVLAFDRTDVPLKNWGGFSIQHSWVYDALEKLVLAGLTDRVVFNTKPLSRVEAARIVGQAVRRIQMDQYGDYNHRGYLEELLYQLVEEFGPELSEMGVRTALNPESPPGLFVYNKALDHAQFGMDFSSRAQRLVNDFGHTAAKGANATATFDGRMHLGDFFSLYYQPEFTWGGNSQQGKLLSGYGKLNFWNLEVTAGRESVWWGPGFRGSMSFSNNAFPLDQVRLSSGEPFTLPWYFRYLGSWKITTFVGQLDEQRDFPYTKVSGLRFDLSPSRFVEVGFNRMFQFGGQGRPSPNPGQFLKLLFFNQGTDNGVNDPLQVNNVLSWDVTVRIPDVQRYIRFTRDMSLYVDFGYDDTSGGVIVPKQPGGIVGTYMTGIFGDPKLDLRLEYARTSSLQFNHFIYLSGFTNRGSVLSHFIGTSGSELYARVTRWVSPDLLLGVQGGLDKIGSTLTPAPGPTEGRNFFGSDASYRLSDRSSIFVGYNFTKVTNRDFLSGKSGNEHLFSIEFTQKFGQ